MPTHDEIVYPARLKIQRAGKHLSEIEALVDAFLVTRPFELVIDHQPLKRLRTHRIHQRASTPPEFSMVVGDVIHNLRAALDVAIFQIIGPVAANPDTVHFPFARSEQSVESTLVSRQCQKGGERLMDALRSLRLYPGGNDLLCSVHALDILDKHKQILTVGSVVAMSGDDFSRIDPFLPFRGPGILVFQDLTELFQIELQYPSLAAMLADKPQLITPRIQPEFQICFGADQPLYGQEVCQTLRDAMQAVEDAIELVAASAS